MAGVTKRFPGTLALDGVDLTVRRGEIHALLGQNGAGKSTLVKILAGDYAASEGEVRIDGRPVAVRNTRDAMRLGIGIVYQELSLLPNLTVAENMYLGREPGRAGGGTLRTVASIHHAQDGAKRPIHTVGVRSPEHYAALCASGCRQAAASRGPKGVARAAPDGVS